MLRTVVQVQNYRPIEFRKAVVTVARTKEERPYEDYDIWLTPAINKVVANSYLYRNRQKHFQWTSKK
jgi:hypothetical protein